MKNYIIEGGGTALKPLHPKPKPTKQMPGHTPKEKAKKQKRKTTVKKKVVKRKKK